MWSPDVRLELRTELHQIPVPVLVQLMRLVPYAIADVRREVDNALDLNPYLTRLPGTACPGCGRHIRGRRCASCAAMGARGVESTIVAPVDWRADLANAVCLEFAPASRALVEHVVDHIDDRGLLEVDAATIGARQGATAADVAAIISWVREVGPPGIAARSPLECVRLQCVSLVEGGDAPPVLLDIVDRHLELVASDMLDELAVAVGCPRSEVDAAVRALRHRTRPFVMLDDQPPPYVEPDLIVRYAAGRPDRLVVEVADASWFGLRTGTAPRGGEAWAAQYVSAADAFIRQLDVRASVLRRIGDVLVDVQRDFLVGGPSMHRPLRRSEVADRLGVHPSTIGRSIRDKRVRCPDGRLIELASCFGSATGPMEALRERLAEHPCASDRELVAILASADVHLARRTVAKYRAALGTPARRAKPASPQAS